MSKWVTAFFCCMFQVACCRFGVSKFGSPTLKLRRLKKFGLSNLFDRRYRRFKVWMIENCNLGLKSTTIGSDFEAGLVMSK